MPEDHLQLRIDDLLDFEETLGISIGSMGTQVLADSQESGVVASAIESALNADSILGTDGDDFIFANTSSEEQTGTN